MTLHLCPVCRQSVAATTRGNIGWHLDTLRAENCPGAGEPFTITIAVTPEFQAVMA